MLQKYREGTRPAQAPALRALSATASPTSRRAVRDTHLRSALPRSARSDWELVTALNREIDERKPWVLFKEERDDELDALLYDLCEGLRWLAILLHPVMPERMDELWRRLGASEPLSPKIGRVRWRGGVGSKPGAEISTGEAALSTDRAGAATPRDRYPLPPARPALRRRSRGDDRPRPGSGRDAHARRSGAILPTACARSPSRKSSASLASVGIHPHEAKDAPPDIAAAFTRADRRCAACRDRRDGAGLLLRSQPARGAGGVLRAQIRFARERDLPVIFHQRDAFDDFLAILRQEFARRDARRRALLHRRRTIKR